MNSPRVSVLMSVYRPSEQYVDHAIRSILSQTLSDFELIVIEDPSDRTAEPVIERAEDSRIRYIRNPRRVPLADSRNQAIEAARSDLVAIMDADDLSMPERLQRQCDHLDANPDISVLGSQIELIDAEDRSLGFRHYPEDDQRIRRKMRQFNPVAHPSVMLRKSSAMAVGGYRARNDAACDDYELWSRMARHGLRFANLPEPLLRYRLHPQAMKRQRILDTLADTIAIKEEYWSADFTLTDRLRIWGEKALRWLPPSLIMFLFLRVVSGPRPTSAERRSS